MPVPRSEPTAPPSRRLGFRHVEALRAVMLAGTVTGAATRLSVTQPAISKLVRDAEERLRLTLFDRRAGRLVPTPAAHRLFDEIERSFTGLDEINAVGERLRREPQRQLTIAATPALAAAVLPPVIAEYRRAVEPAFFRVLSRSTEQVAALVGSGKADLGFSLDGPAAPGLHAEPLGVLPIVCCLPAAHRLAARPAVSAADLCDEPMVTLSHAEGIDTVVAEGFREAGRLPPPVVECPAVVTACAMVGAGIGFALVNPTGAALLRSAGIAVRRFEPALELRFRACWPTAAPARFARDRLVELAREALAAIAAPWAGGNAAQKRDSR